MKKRKISIALILCTPLLLFGFLCMFSAAWYINVFGDVGFDAILYTLFSDIDGTESGLVLEFLLNAALPALIFTALSVFVIFFTSEKKLSLEVAKHKFRIYPFPKWLSAVISVVLTAVLIVTACVKVHFDTYLSYMLEPSSTFIEDNYVDPQTANITFPEQKQNLIILYLESMETSFADASHHGGNDVNPIPELCELAEENVNFSHTESLGGFTSPTGTTWTVAALVAMNCGVPLKLPLGISSNSYGKEHFMPGITTLTDILHENGYYQAFMCGSQATFGGRRQLYVEHGVDEICDHGAAMIYGIVPYGYAVWWGMEDIHLFEYAKQKLPEMASRGQPFALSMLTVDTHHVGGYVCDVCEEEYPERYENVLACSSRQVYAFIEWVKQQDFYENTTIVICGDHPTMDAGYAERNLPEGYDRKVYNCFINAIPQAVKEKNREFTSLDMFPTILASIGCTFDGDRLGPGTNLFSASQTLSEELGRDELDAGISKKSDYYNDVFLGLNL
ncbi:MAG: LTA synthase family protein, partial [Clostridia bacterium]|nr:LTA synthase family protein [Clostridia bacterium]